MKIPVLLVFIFATARSQDTLKSGQIIDILKLLLSNSGKTQNIPTSSAPTPTKYTGPGTFPDYYENDDVSIGTHAGDQKNDENQVNNNDYPEYHEDDNPDKNDDYDSQIDNQIDDYDEAGTEFESFDYESEDYNNLSQNQIDDYPQSQVLFFVITF